MKQSNFSFLGPDVIAQGLANANNPVKAFDWDQAAKIIKEVFAKHPDVIAEAGLQGDWEYTSGIIFTNGKPTNAQDTYLASTWATPTLILTWDGEEQMEVSCFAPQDERFDAGTKWDEQSLAILGLPLATSEI